MKIFSGSLSTGLRHSANNASTTSSGSFQLAAARLSFASYLPLGFLMNSSFQTSMSPGMWTLPVGIDVQPRGQQHHLRVGPENGTRRTGRGYAAANRGIKTLHARRIGQVVLDRTVDARQCIVQARQPAVVLHHQLLEELRALVRETPARSAQAAGRFCAAGHDRLPLADLKIAAEEIQHARERAQPDGEVLFLRAFRRFRVQLRHAQIEPAQPGVAQERVDEIALRLFARAQPVIRRIKNGGAGGW